jgi:predicted small secreted protein
VAGKLRLELKRNMKRSLLIAAIIALSTACDGDVKVNEKEIEAAGDKLQNTVEKGVDTLGSKLKKLKNKIDDQLDTIR